MAEELRGRYSLEERVALYDRFKDGHASFDATMRRIVLRAMVKSMGHDVVVGPGVAFLHPDRFEIEDGVFLGSGAFLQGRHDGECRIGRRTWLGPGAYLDARALVFGEYVGFGPGAKVLGSEHLGIPVEAFVTETDLRIAPVNIGKGADIGCNAVILPGVTVGEGAIVGAGAIVTHDVAPYTIVAGVPAKKLRDRREEKR